LIAAALLKTFGLISTSIQLLKVSGSYAKSFENFVKLLLKTTAKKV